MNNNNSLNNNKIIKVKSCKNIFEDEFNKSKLNKNSINSFRKSCLYKSEINTKLFYDKDSSSKLRKNYNFKNINNNEENTNQEEANNILKIINKKIYDNVNKNKIKLPIIK